MIIEKKRQKAVITKQIVNVDGEKVLTYVSNGLETHNFIDTGLKFFGHKVYECWQFLDDKEYRTFKGYFYIGKSEYLDTRKGSKKLWINNGKTFFHFSKSNRQSWSEWFEIMSNDNEICSKPNKRKVS